LNQIVWEEVQNKSMYSKKTLISKKFIKRVRNKILDVKVVNKIYLVLLKLPKALKT